MASAYMRWRSVDALFLFHAEAAALIAAGVQVFLHGFTNGDVFALNLVAERTDSLGGFAAQILFRKIKLEDSQSALRFERQIMLGRRCRVQSASSWGRPRSNRGEAVASFLIARGVSSPGARRGSGSTGGRGGRGFDGVGVEVEFAVESGVDGGQM